MEPENPGWHTTDTLDFGIVISGEIDLELDDGTHHFLESLPQFPLVLDMYRNQPFGRFQQGGAVGQKVVQRNDKHE